MAYHTYERMHYPGLVLICQGAEDAIAPLCYAKEAQETFGDAELHMIGGAGHGFRGCARTEAAGAAVDFISHVLGQKDGRG